jgi:hypothetical protein
MVYDGFPCSCAALRAPGSNGVVQRHAVPSRAAQGVVR